MRAGGGLEGAIAPHKISGRGVGGGNIFQTVNGELKALHETRIVITIITKRREETTSSNAW